MGNSQVDISVVILLLIFPEFYKTNIFNNKNFLKSF